MKTRESGMPDEAVWESFFKPMEVLRALGLVRDTEPVVDFGSGYGTFSLAAAKMIKGEVVGQDIETNLSPCIDLPPWHYGFTAKARNNNAIKP